MRLERRKMLPFFFFLEVFVIKGLSAMELKYFYVFIKGGQVNRFK